MEEFLNSPFGGLLFIYVLFAIIIGVIVGAISCCDEVNKRDWFAYYILHPMEMVKDTFHDDNRNLLGKCYAIPCLILVIIPSIVSYLLYWVLNIIFFLYRLGFKNRNK